MKCQDVQLAINIASCREPMSRSASMHLSDCPDCRHYADETDALLKLISAQPRVQAPADFDFKLRARIARAQSEPSSPAAFFEKLWGRTFSWSQAAVAMATVGLAVTLTTFHFIQNDRSNPSGDLADNGTRAVTVTTNPSVMEPVPLAPSAEIAAGATIRPRAVKTIARISKAPSTTEKSPLIETNRSEIARAENRPALDETGLRVYDITRAQIVIAPSGNLYGAEGSNSRSGKQGRN
jgi:hypothetical protein